MMAVDVVAHMHADSCLLPPSPPRRLLLLLLLLLLVQFCTSVWGFINGFAAPNTVVVEVALPRLPRSLDAFRVVLMSDIHTGQTVGAQRVEAAVAIANSLTPDIAIIAGEQ